MVVAVPVEAHHVPPVAEPYLDRGVAVRQGLTVLQLDQLQVLQGVGGEAFGTRQGLASRLEQLVDRTAVLGCPVGGEVDDHAVNAGAVRHAQFMQPQLRLVDVEPVVDLQAPCLQQALVEPEVLLDVTRRVEQDGQSRHTLLLRLSQVDVVEVRLGEAAVLDQHLLLLLQRVEKPGELVDRTSRLRELAEDDVLESVQYGFRVVVGVVFRKAPVYLAELSVESRKLIVGWLRHGDSFAVGRNKQDGFLGVNSIVSIENGKTQPVTGVMAACCRFQK